MHYFQQCESLPVFRRAVTYFVALIISVVMAQHSSAQTAEIKSAPLASAALARGSGDLMVNAADVLSELRRAPAADRQTILSQPDSVRQIVSNLLVRRVLAAQAVRDGADADPVLAATLAIARDRVLSDARLARLDAQNTPNDAALDAYARNTYQANASKFEIPAQTRARHILLAKSGPESLQKAKEILTQLRAGASFEELAKANSVDPGSAVRGGDLGFFEAGKMVPSFDQALSKLSKPGELSEPIESEFGYHLIRLEERKERGLKSYDEVREQLLAQARAAILNESRVQLVLTLTKDFVFESEAIEALAKPATP